MSSDTTVLYNACYILDGMHNDDATKCWVEILRHGVVFRIEALSANLEDTPFHQQWQTLLKDLYAPGMTIQDRIDRWDQLCNLLIDASLPVLQNLAPEAPADRSLRAHFHTPTYELQIARDPASGAVHASIASGPVDGLPSRCQVANVGDIDAFAPGVKQYPAHDIEVLEPNAESSFPPRRVRMPGGTIHGFKACVKDATRLPTNHVENHHKDAIHAYLALHKEPLGVPGIPSVAGVVVDEGALAGVLLEDIEGAQNLPSRLETVATVEGVERVRGLVPGWRARIEAVVERLHSRGFCLNREVSQSSLDESLLIVDKDDCIWLPLSSIFQMDEDREELRTHVNKDKEAVRQILEQYVLEELTKVETRVEVE